MGKTATVFETDSGEFSFKRGTRAATESFPTRGDAAAAVRTLLPGAQIVHADAGPADVEQAAALFVPSIWASVAEMPVEVPVQPDGDDTALNTPDDWATRVLPLSVSSGLRVLTAAAHVQQAPVVVPLKRVIHRGDTGQDVLGINRSLQRAGYLPRSAVTRTWSQKSVDATKRFKQKLGVKNPDGVFGETAHRMMMKVPAVGKHGEWAYDPYCGWLMARYTPPSKEEIARNAGLAAALFAVAMRDKIGYWQYRPMYDMLPPPNVPNMMDCSWFATWVYKCMRAPDPCGYNYAGWGNTTSQLQHGKSVARAQMKLMDLLFYQGHVTVNIGDGKCASHGSSSGPIVAEWDYRPDFLQSRTYPV